MTRILVCLVALSLFALSTALECAHRDYGNGATVCVCNATYCDDLKPVEKTANGVITAFSTSKDGDRFSRKQIVFTTEHHHEIHDIAVSLKREKKYQKIVGFGGAFTDATGINIAKLPKNLQSQVVKDYFSNNGLEYTLGRIPIAGSDFSTRKYSYDDHPGDENLSKFALQEEDIKFKIPYIQEAQQVSSHRVKLFGSPWSPPAWMKTNNESEGSGKLIGKPGTKYYKIYAKYFIKFLKEYEKHNITLWGLTVQNEPGPHNYNSLGLSAEDERDFLKLDLGPELHSNGYSKEKMKIMIYDYNLPGMKDYVTTVLSDKQAADFASGIAFHWYATAQSNRSDLRDLHQKFPNHFLLATEACEEWNGKQHHVSLGNWHTFERYALDIIKDLNYYSTGWTDWNMALDLEGGPNWIKNFVDAPIIVNATSQEYYKQPFFYAMGHFSKFLVPDSIRVHHTSNSHHHGHYDITVWERPDNSTVMVILNKNTVPLHFHVHDASHGYFDVTLKANSMQTLIWY